MKVNFCYSIVLKFNQVSSAQKPFFKVLVLKTILNAFGWVSRTPEIDCAANEKDNTSQTISQG